MQKFLRQYRAIPHSTAGITLHKLLFNRDLKTINQKQFSQSSLHDSAEFCLVRLTPVRTVWRSVERQRHFLLIIVWKIKPLETKIDKIFHSVNMNEVDPLLVLSSYKLIVYLFISLLNSCYVVCSVCNSYKM